MFDSLLMNTEKMKELTRAEDEIMQILWEIKKGFVKDIIEKMPDPKPAYNTVSTIVRILVKKGFIGYTAFGKTHQYHPIVEKSEYSNFYLKKFIGSYFEGSFEKMVSFFAKENEVDNVELEEMIKKIEDELNEK